LRNEYLAKEAERRQIIRKEAQDKVDAARLHAKQVSEDLDAAVKRYSGSSNRLSNAKANLAKTAAELQRLGTEKLELVKLFSACVVWWLTTPVGKYPGHLEYVNATAWST
jgi:hypothetical protein